MKIKNQAAVNHSTANQSTANQSTVTNTPPDAFTQDPVLQKKINLVFYFLLVFTWLFACFAIPVGIDINGFFGDFFATNTFLKLTLLFVGTAHLTITAMSLCFHRSHTHQGVRFNPILDMGFQTWLWCMSSISKLDWVSVHIYHHATSDTDKDPHSPVQKGLAHVFFMGVYDYTLAKSWPEVQKIRNRMKRNRYEQFIADHLFLGPVLMASACLFLFGPVYGSVIAFLNFLITPLFAVGGVNALAHQIGYRNYASTDNSRNLGFLFPLNWIICGELDHNNHHHYPKSPSFAHRWFEFDIGWLYIRALKLMGLARVTGSIPYQVTPQVFTRNQEQFSANL